MSSKVTYRTPDFFDVEFRNQIDEYLASHIPEECRPHYRDYLPIIELKIKKTLDNWVDSIRIYADRGDFSYNAATISYDKDSYKLLAKQFIKKMDLVEKNINTNSSYPKGNNYLLGILPQGTECSFSCFWSPRNPYLYKTPNAFVPAVHYEQEPCFHARKHYEEALEGLNTDINLTTSDKEGLFRFHSLYLNNHTNYVAKVTASNFAEGQSKELELEVSKETLENFHHFIYFGQVTPAFETDAEGLLDLLEIAHRWEMPHLFNYSVDLINTYLNNHATLPAKELSWIMTAVFLYDSPNFLENAEGRTHEFLLPCLEKAEALELKATEAEPEPTVNWGLYHRQARQLYALANKNGLKSIEKILAHQIDRALSEASSSSA